MKQVFQGQLRRYGTTRSVSYECFQRTTRFMSPSQALPKPRYCLMQFSTLAEGGVLHQKLASIQLDADWGDVQNSPKEIVPSTFQYQNQPSQQDRSSRLSLDVESEVKSFGLLHQRTDICNVCDRMVIEHKDPLNCQCI